MCVGGTPEGFVPHGAVGMGMALTVESPIHPGLPPQSRGTTPLVAGTQDLPGAADPGFGVRLPGLGSRLPPFLGV